MKIFIGIILLCCPLLSIGQVNIDSLLAVWENELMADTVRLNALQKVYMEGYLYSKPDSALVFGQMAYDLAEEKNYKKEMATSLYVMGVAHSIQADYAKAIDYQRRSLELSKNINNSYGISKSLNSLGNVYLKQSDYAKAIDRYRSSLKIAEKGGDNKTMGSVLNNIGLVYMDLEDYEKSLDYLNRALALKEGNSRSNILNNIGTVYRFKKNYQKALEHYRESLTLKDEFEIEYGAATTYSNIGLVYYALGESSKAADYFNQSLKIHKEIGNKKGIANCLIHIGTLHSISDKDSTIVFASQALEIAQETGSSEEIADAAELLYKTYYSLGKYKLAFEKYELFQNTNEMIHGTRNQKAVFRNELKYQEEKKALEDQVKLEKQLREHQLRIQRERFLLFGGLSMLVLIFSLYFRRRRNLNIAERQKLIHKMDLLKERLATQSVSATGKRKELALDKAKIEKAINAKIGESAWMILNLVFKDPSISNKEIANEVSLSLEGVSSSLRRMYNAFDVKSSSNKKIALIMKAVRISMED